MGRLEAKDTRKSRSRDSAMTMILMIGGTGYIGNLLARELLALGERDRRGRRPTLAREPTTAVLISTEGTQDER